MKNARQDLEKAINIKILYRPFDIRWSFYSGTTKGIVAYPRREVMEHLICDNLALLSTKRVTSFKNWQHVFVSNKMTERCTVSLQTGEVGYVFPLYLYIDDGSKITNMKNEIVNEIKKIVGKISPEEIFDYIYAVIHSPNYQEKYKEFLKIDFPRVPYPKDIKSFKKLVAFGSELRLLHLLESPKLNKFITTYPIVGSDIVEKLSYKKEKVFINSDQYFGNVPEVAWKFYIGGYQPAQKWLKDRKGRTLTNNDIEHYQKIVVALTETHRITCEIDNILN